MVKKPMVLSGMPQAQIRMIHSRFLQYNDMNDVVCSNLWITERKRRLVGKQAERFT